MVHEQQSLTWSWEVFTTPVKTEWDLFSHELHKMNELFRMSLSKSMQQKISHTFLAYPGKCVRPLMMILLFRACSHEGDFLPMLPLLTAVENIHTASLLHDDVIDAGQKRRGHMCVQHVVGNRYGILLGDAIWMQGSSLLLDIPHPSIIRFMHKAMNSMIMGQLQEGEMGFSTPLSQYEYMIYKKTGCLFEAAFYGVTYFMHLPHVASSFAEFGALWGKGFQLLDDVWDYYESPISVSKEKGQDFRTRKKTFPLLWAYQHGTPHEKKEIKKVWEQASWRDMRSLLEKMGAFQATLLHADNFFRVSIERLQSARKELPMDTTQLSLLKDFLLS